MTPTSDELATFRFFDYLQQQGKKVEKTALLKEVQSFVYSYDPTYTTTKAQVVLDSIVKDANAIIVTQGGVTYVKLTPSGYVLKRADFGILE